MEEQLGGKERGEEGKRRERYFKQKAGNSAWELEASSMTAHSSSLAWRIAMDRGAWRCYGAQGCRESDTTEQLRTVRNRLPQSYHCTGIAALCLEARRRC